VAGKRLARKTTILLCTIASAAAVAMSGYSSGSWLFAAALSAFDFFTILYSIAAAGLLMGRAPYERFAVHLGGVGASAAIVAPTAGGLFVESYGFRALQGLTVLLLVLAATLLWLYSSNGYAVVPPESEPSAVRAA